jgi:N-acetylglutamate synthase (N-acetylornithine aminotransferase)
LRNNSISDQYDEEAVKRSMKDKNIEISLIFSHGKSNATVWTSDLTYNYVKINAEYRS